MSQLNKNQNYRRIERAREWNGFLSEKVTLDKNKKKYFNTVVAEAAEAIVFDHFKGQAYMRSSYGTPKVDKLSPSSCNIYYSDDVPSELQDPKLPVPPPEQVYRHHYAYSTNSVIGLDEREMKSYGYSPKLREIALILKEITGIWYDMCTVKLGYKYTDPDPHFKKQKQKKYQ